jgi:hypothetical protein
MDASRSPIWPDFSGSIRISPMATRKRFKPFLIPAEEPPPGIEPQEQDYLLEITRKQAKRIARGKKRRR